MIQEPFSEAAKVWQFVLALGGLIVIPSLIIGLLVWGISKIAGPKATTKAASVVTGLIVLTSIFGGTKKRK